MGNLEESTSQIPLAFILDKILFFSRRFYLFIHERHTHRERERKREREAETQAKGEAASMQGAGRGTRSQVSRTTPGAKP